MFDFPSGIEAIVSGWGSEQEVHEEDCIIFLSENMKILKVRTISNEECQSLHEVINIDETHICAVSENKSENASKVSTFKVIISQNCFRMLNLL